MRKFLIFLFALLLPLSGAFACADNEIDVLGDGSQCQVAKFSVTTRTDARELKWTMSAAGTFYVDCGDGGTLGQNTSSYGTLSGNTINRTSAGVTTYTCTWNTAGEHTIRFSGTATGYSSDGSPAISFYIRSGGTQEKIASISGSLGAIFKSLGIAINGIPIFSDTFLSTRITEIPAGLFSGIDTSSATNTSNMFNGTFSSTDITSIPAELFSSINTSSATDTSSMFSYTFYGCTSLTSIPAELFSSINTSSATNTSFMFENTFAECNILEEIPAGLFSSINTSSATNTSGMFYGTFYVCASLTSIPAGLFSSITIGSATDATGMFERTFSDCFELSGYIPPSTFAGLIANGSPTADDMWYETFNSTNLLTTCPAGTGQHITGYEGTTNGTTWNGKVSCEPCTGTLPANATYTAGTCSWTCDDGYISTGTQCELAKFSVTTTSDATELKWTMTAMGTFYADCGDGGTLTQNTTSGGTISDKTVNRTSTYSTTYTCTWDTAGEHMVRFGGAATQYSSVSSTAAISFSGATAARVASISGSLGAMFPQLVTGAGDRIPRFYRTFSGCTSLTEIPSDLFSNITTGESQMFSGTFSGCTSLTEIPAGLFSNITTGAYGMFSGTFSDCTSLTEIPAGLFSNITTGARYMFSGTFSGCTSLTEIPAGLFSGITTGAGDMFYQTFNGCTSLTEIPAGLFSGIATGVGDMGNMFAGTFARCTSLTEIPGDLFSGITIGAQGMFSATFAGCSNLGGYIPPSTFAGLIANRPSTATYMWSNTFYDTKLLTTCPAGTGQYITGYEGTTNGTTWNGKVSCEPCTGTLPANATYTAGTCSWTCDTGYTLNNGECVVKDDTFTVTTVEMSAGATFTFKMTAKGTFRVNCGDGGVLSGTGVSGNTITRTNTTEATYTCTYPSAGVHKITFAKVSVTGYFTNNTTGTLTFRDNTNVAGISGSIGSVFPTITPGVKGETPPLSYMFAGCTNLSGKIPENLLSGIYGEPVAWQFRNMFQGCTSLEGPIPAGLFADIQGPAQQGVFGHVFSGCTNLKGPIPAGLFSGVTGTANYLFTNTFYNCSSLDGEIPADLFGGTTGTPADYMFRETFMGCSSLTGWIPKTLFSGLSGEAKTGTFSNMFKNCTSLEGYIPPELFATITSSNATVSMPGIFTDSSIATTCEVFPQTKQYITGFESAFDGHVSCEMLPCDGTMYKGRCRQLCPVGRALLHAGEYTYPVWSDKTDVPSPVLHIRRDENTVCYVYLEPNVEGEHGLKLRFTDGNVYRAIDPR